MLAVFVVLILCGITTANAGIDVMTQDPTANSVIQLGRAQPIRSDEYWVTIPAALSIMATGDVPTFSPLGEAANFALRYSGGGFGESIVFFHSDILRAGTWLPQNIVFAAFWWMPVIVLFLGAPLWFQHVAGSRLMGWLAAFLMVLSPSSAWWSLGPINCIAFAIAGSALLISCYKRVVARQFVRAALLGLVSAILLTGIPSMYAPWSIVLGVPVLFATVAWIFANRDSALWQRVVPVGAVGVVALGLFGLTVLENSASIQALANTLYPGERRLPSESMSPARLLGAPGLGSLADQTPVTSNASSITSSYTIAFVVSALLVVGGARLRPVRDSVVIVVVGGFGLVFLGWATLQLGDASKYIPVLNLIPPYRVAGVIGFLAILLMCLLLLRVPRQGRTRLAMASGLVTGLVSSYGVSQLRLEFLPGMSVVTVIGSSVGVGVCTFLLIRYTDRLWALAVVVVLAVIPIVGSNPILVGLADLRGSETAQALALAGVEARADKALWVSDSPSFTAAMLSAGLPALSGGQRMGPDAREWARLDPTGEAEAAWNRGGGFIFFEWTPGDRTIITTPQSDIISVKIDPCELAQKFPEVTTIASGSLLSSSCLTDAGTLEWSGEPVHLYLVG